MASCVCFGHKQWEKMRKEYSGIVTVQRSASEVQKKAVEHQHPSNVWKCQHSLCNLHELLCFKRGGCWFLCCFWQSDWLTSRHCSLRNSWDWKCNGHGDVHSERVLLKTEVALCADSTLPGSSALGAAGPLCHSHTPTNTSSSVPSSPRPSASWVGAAGGCLTLTTLKQTAFHQFDFYMLDGRTTSKFPWLKYNYPEVMERSCM